MTKRVLLAAPRGYCAGVDRAVVTVEKALDLYGPPVYVRKQIVHNKYVVQTLEARGAIFVDEVEEVPEGSTVVFSAHGVAPVVHEEAAERGLKTIDATCPLVTKVHAEVRRCFLDTLTHVGSNGAALLCNTVPACLVEDNILYRAFPLIEVNHGSSGNVFAYNLCEDSAPGVAIDSNHGPHNAFNLYEGNITPNLQSDGYFGSASADTVFRNWLHGIIGGQMAWTVSLNRFTRAYSLIGNILQRDGFTLAGDGVSLGNPNMGNSSYNGTAPPWTDGALAGAGTLTQSGGDVAVSSPMFTSAHVGWFIMTPATSGLALITVYKDAQHVTVNSSQTLSGAAYILTPGPAGYQGLDTGVAATLVRKGNFSYFAGAIPAAEATAPDPVPASLFRAGKPLWFGDLPWPPFDATKPQPAYTAIPAGYRWVNGVGPAPDPTKTQPPINVRIGK